MQPYDERFPLKDTPCKYYATKVAPIENIENFLVELEKLAENIGDDAIRSDCLAMIENICVDRDICEECYTKIDEVWLNEGLFRNCNCKSKCISRNEAV